MSTPRKSQRNVSLAVVLALLSFSQDAVADSAAEAATAALVELRFDDAREAAIIGLEQGTRGPRELAELYMILGRVSASEGEDAEAESYFQAALSLNKNASLGASVSPKLSAPFENAQHSLEGSSAIELLSEVSDDAVLSVQISSDPAELVGGVEARYQENGEEQRKRAKGIGTLHLQLPSGASDIHVVLIDPHGNRLVDVTPVEVVPDEPLANVHAGTVATSSTPAVYERWQLYAGLAVVSLGAGGYFGTVSRAKTDEIENLDDGTEFTVAQQLEDEAGRNALYANIGFATALGFGAASLWMLMREDGGAPEPQTTTLAPLLGSDRIGFTANVAF